jgi:hypothetical protein
VHWIRSSTLERGGPGSRWWASGTLGVEKPLGSYWQEIQDGTVAGASVVASKTSWAWSRLGSMAFAAHVDGKLGFAYCSVVVRNGRVDGCPPSGPGCSRRRVIVPLPEGVGMKSP